MTNVRENDRIYKTALLVSLSCVLQISESMIPHPIPGLRLGLANMPALIALVLLGFRAAMEIAVFRTLLSSLMMGTFMSPTFFLSFAGAVAGTLAMGLFFRFSACHMRYGFSIVGISIVGALTHNMVQLYLAYLILVKHSGIFAFFPWLSAGAAGTGWITGTVAGGVCRRVKEKQGKRGPADGIAEGVVLPELPLYHPAHSFLHRLSPQIKIMGVFILSLPVLMCDDLRTIGSLWLFAAVLVLLSGTPVPFLFLRIKRYAFLVLVAFSLPLFFNSGTHVLFGTGHFPITHEGLNRGILLAVRILFMVVLSSLLVRTTSPAELSRGLAGVLSPLACIGIPQKRIGTMFSLSWTAVPVVWETARQAIRSANLSKAKNLRHLIPLLSNLIARLYLETEPGSDLWRAASQDQDKPCLRRPPF